MFFQGPGLVLETTSAVVHSLEEPVIPWVNKVTLEKVISLVL